MDIEKFGERLQAERKKKHLTGEQLAELTNLSTTYIRQLENGMRLPSLPVFVDLINSLECRADILLTDSAIASTNIVLNELTEKMQGLSPERIGEIAAVVNAMLSYMK